MRRPKKRDAALARTIGRRVKAAREKIKLSRLDLARAIEVDRVEVLRIEHGQRTPRIETLVRIARLLRVPITKLLS